MTWTMWAYKYDNYYMHFGVREYVAIHHLDYPIVKVELTEDPAGDYYGWVEGEKLHGAYVWASNAQLEMCFAYGSKAEEKRYNGRKVRLSVKNAK